MRKSQTQEQRRKDGHSAMTSFGVLATVASVSVAIYTAGQMNGREEGLQLPLSNDQSGPRPSTPEAGNTSNESSLLPVLAGAVGGYAIAMVQETLMTSNGRNRNDEVVTPSNGRNRNDEVVTPTNGPNLSSIFGF